MRKYMPFQSAGQVDEYLGKVSSQARAHFLLHCLRASLDMGLRHDPSALILDGYWFKYIAAEIAHGGDEAALVNLTKHFPSPDLILYLDTDEKTGAQRKESYSGYECGFAAERNAETFVAFQKKVNANFANLIQQQACVRINARQSKTAVLEAAMAVISNQIPALSLRADDEIFSQVSNNPAFHIAILGIDGTGKSGLLRGLQHSPVLAGKNITSMTCPEFHRYTGRRIHGIV